MELQHTGGQLKIPSSKNRGGKNICTDADLHYLKCQKIFTLEMKARKAPKPASSSVPLFLTQKRRSGQWEQRVPGPGRTGGENARKSANNAPQQSKERPQPWQQKEPRPQYSTCHAMPRPPPHWGHTGPCFGGPQGLGEHEWARTRDTQPPGAGREGGTSQGWCHQQTKYVARYPSSWLV